MGLQLPERNMGVEVPQGDLRLLGLLRVPDHLPGSGVNTLSHGISRLEGTVGRRGCSDQCNPIIAFQNRSRLKQSIVRA